MTKPYKATQLWLDMYDDRHTLFIFKCIPFFLTNHQMDFCLHLHNPMIIPNKTVSIFRVYTKFCPVSKITWSTTS